MFTEIAIAVGLVVATVVMHAVGFAILIRAMIRTNALDRTGFLTLTRVVVALACWLILIHLAEMSAWGLYFVWRGCLPDLESALYFSGVTYTTVGYGEVVLAKPWRMLAPVEAVTGILMCGISTGLFFAIISRWLSHWVQRNSTSRNREAVAGRNQTTTEE